LKLLSSHPDIDENPKGANGSNLFLLAAKVLVDREEEDDNPSEVNQHHSSSAMVVLQ
jgi:hypothetical protein